MLVAAPGVAIGAEPIVRFDVPAEPMAQALVDLALQAGVSIDTGKAGRCAAPAHPLKGAYTVRAALETLLAGSGCSLTILDGRAFAVAPSPHVDAAPEPETSAPPQAPEVVVVATRRATPQDRLAFSVSTVSGQSLVSQGVHDVEDTALLTPAMTVTNLGLGRDKILLRGLSDGPLTGHSQTMVGLYLDDVRLTYNAPDPDLRLVDVARVEVLRGPQGALYGAGSLGGVVQVVTAQPDREHLGGWIDGSAGATVGGDGVRAVDGAVNLPFGGGRGAVRLVGYSEYQGGYINDRPLDLRNVNRSDRQGGRIAAALAIGPGWDLSAGAVAQAIDASDTQYAVAGQPAYTRANRLREPHDNDFAEAHLGLRGDLGFGDLRLSVASIQHRLQSRYDASDAPPAASPGTPDAFDETNNIHSVVAEATLVSKNEAAFDWFAGLFYARSVLKDHSALTDLSGPQTVVLDEIRHDQLDEAAVYGDAALPLSPGWTLTLGGRFFSVRTTVSSVIRAPLETFETPVSGRVDQSGFAPRVVLSYSPDSRSLVYLQAAEGYRAGGFNTFGPPEQAFTAFGEREPNRNYRGDELWSFEAGAKVRLLDDRARIRIAGFEAFWRDIQSDQLLASGLPYTANIGDGRNQGVEFEGEYLWNALDLRANFLVDAPELVRPNPAFSTRRDLSLSVVPAFSGGVSAHYAWPVLRDYRLELDGRWAYVGGSRLLLAETLSPKMGDYAVGRLGVALATPRWRAALIIDNPANTYGNTFAYGNPFTVRTVRQITPLRPLTVSVTLGMAL